MLHAATFAPGPTSGLHIGGPLVNGISVPFANRPESSSIAQGRSTPTPGDVRDFSLPPGTHGIGIHYLNGGSAYTGTTTPSPTPI